MGIFLYLLSSILKWALTPFLYSYGLIRSAWKGELQKYHFRLALSKDQYGNVLGQYFFNDVWIKPNGAKFGKPDETMSSVLGKNKKMDRLRGFGKLIADTLNKLDPNHVENSIEDDERNQDTK